MPTPLARERLGYLDSVRGLAAFLVMIHHMIVLSPHPFAVETMFMLSMTPLAPILMGQPFVMIFFVLSGLVLTLALQRGVGPLIFILRRIVRLMLPLIAAVLVAAGLVYMTGGRGSGEGYADWFAFIDANQPDLVTAERILRHIAMTGFISDEGFDTVIWSLALELRLSILMPVIVLAVRYLPKLSLVSAILVGLFADLALHGQLPGFDRRMVIGDGLFLINDLTGTILATLAVLPAFVLGAWLALNLATIRTSLQNLTRREIFLTSAAIAIGLGLPVIVGTALAAAGLLALVSMDGSAKRWLETRTLKFLGRISYSLYLTHFPILIAAVNLLGNHLPRLVVFGLAGIVALGFATLFHRLVEAPSINLARRIGGRST